MTYKIDCSKIFKQEYVLISYVRGSKTEIRFPQKAEIVFESLADLLYNRR